MCLYLGVSSQHKVFKCLNKSSNMFIFKDVMFNDHHSPFPTMFQTNVTCTSQHTYEPKSNTFAQLSTQHPPNMTSIIHVVADSIPQVV